MLVNVISVTLLSSSHMYNKKSFSVDTWGQENDTITLRVFLYKGHKLKRLSISNSTKNISFYLLRLMLGSGVITCDIRSRPSFSLSLNCICYEKPDKFLLLLPNASPASSHPPSSSPLPCSSYQLGKLKANVFSLRRGARKMLHHKAA